jgi:hypothetical protein
VNTVTVTNRGSQTCLAGTAALVLALVAGCSQSSTTPPFAASPAVAVKCGLSICHHGRPGQPCTIAGSTGRITMGPNKLVCSPSPGKSPSVSAAPPSSRTLDITTQMGWSVTYVGSRAPVFRLHRPPLSKITSAPPACRVAATNPGTALQLVHRVKVVYVNMAGNKIAAGSVALPVIGIGPGNTVRAVAAVPRGAVSCRARGWSPR